MGGRNRRKFMKSAAGATALAITGGVAGCLEQIPSFGGSPAPDKVPEDGDAVIYADVATILKDEGVRTLTNVYLDQQSEYEYYDGPEDFEEVLSEFENEADFEASQLNEATAFFGYSDAEYVSAAVDNEFAGVRLRIDVSVEALVDGLENSFNNEFEQKEYEGQVVYVSEDGETWVGVLPADGSVVVGTEDAVKDTIDVENGDEDSIGEELTSAYAESRSAPFRFAGYVPSTSDYEFLPEETNRPSGDGGEVTYELAVFDDVETVAGAVYRDGSLRGMELDFNADGADTAEELAELLDDLQSGWIDTFEDAEYDEQVGDEAAEILEGISIEQNGSTVTVGLEREIDELEGLIEEYTGP